MIVNCGDDKSATSTHISGEYTVRTTSAALASSARGSVSAIWHGCEIFTGYDFLRIGGTNLQGPMVGVRFWF